jgi:hypothetical protein
MTRADIHARFVRVVARGIERAEREHAEHLAQLRESGYKRGRLSAYPIHRRLRES